MSEQTLELQITSNSEGAITSLKSLETALTNIQTAVEKGLDASGISKQMQAFSEAIQNAVPEETVQKLERISGAIENIKSVGNVKIKIATEAADIKDTLEIQESGIERVKGEIRDISETGQAANVSVSSSAEEIADKYINATSAVDLLKMKLDALKGELVEGIKDQSFDGKKIANYSLQIQRLQEQIRNFKETVDDSGISAKKSSGFFGKLVSSFGRIAFYRAIRAALKAVTDGFREGVENVRKYSEAIGSGFAKDMSSAAASLSTLKNSVGAAVAPALQALIPILSTITSFAITAFNALNQLFSLLRGGGSWTRATASMNDYTKAAKGAGGATKDLLADWDELNIIQSQGGGGGGGSDIDYTDMFEEVYEFDSRIREIADFIKSNADEIWSIIKRIGAAILAWNVSKAFGGILGMLGGWAVAGLTISIVFDMVTLFDKQYLKTGEIGWLIGDVLTTALGAGIANQVLKTVAGHGAGVAVASITIAFSAAASILAYIGATDVDALSEEGITTAVLGALKFGAGIFLLDKGMLGATTGTALAEGLSGAAIVLGAAVGVKAVLQAAESGITESTWRAAALSSVAMGLGTFGIAKVLGASVAAALGIGGIGAIATGLVLAASIGVVAYLQSQKSDIHWGNRTVTEAEIKAFVESDMFSIPFTPTLELIDATITDANNAAESVRNNIQNMLIPMGKIRLNVDTDQAKKDLETAIFGADDGSGNRTGGVIESVKALAKARETEIETGFTLVPVKGENGEDLTAEMIKAGSSAWEGITAAMDDLGKELSDHLTKSMTDNLEPGFKDFEDKMVVLIAETMRNVSFASAGASVETEALSGLTFGLADLDEKSFKNAMNLFNEYKEKLKTGYQKAYQDSANALYTAQRTYETLADGYLKMAEEYKSQGMMGEAAEAMKKYEQYTASATEMSERFTQAIDNMTESVDASVEAASELGKQKIRYAINTIFGDALKNVNTGIADVWIDNLFAVYDSADNPKLEDLKSAMAEVVSKITGIPYEALKALDSSGLEFLTEEAIQTIYQDLVNIFDEDFAKKVFEASGFNIPEQIQKQINEATQEAAEAVEGQEPQSIVIPMEAQTVIQQADETMDFGFEYDAEATKQIELKAPVEIVPEYVYATESALRYNLEGFENYYGRANEKGMANAELFYDTGIKDNIAQMLERAGYDATSEAAQSILQNFHDQWMKFASTEDYDWDVTIDDLIASLKESIEDPSQLILDNPLPAVDGSELVDSLASLNSQVDAEVSSIESSLQRLLNDLYMLNGITLRGGAGGSRLRFGVASKPMYTFAEGGFPTTGDMFIAREAGPELVGRMGNKTAVANNDQIINGVASGVAAGQAEQNALLRQQNDYLRRILAKESTVKVEPSASWGRFNKRSEEMRVMGAGA